MIRLREPGCFEILNTLEQALPGEGEALVRVKHVGLCGTDIHAYRGNQPFFEYPRVLGHELGVVVEALGPGVDALRVGMHCAVEPYLAERGDRAFARGRTNCSSSTRCLGVHLDGGMQDWLVLPAAKLHWSTLDTESLALVETLCIGHHAVERAALAGDESVVVVGMGPIGLGVALFARLSGASVVCCDLSRSRLERAKSIVGLADFQLIGEGQTLGDCWNERGEEAPEAVFDCTGNRDSMNASIGLAGFGGKVVLVGITKGELSFPGPDFHKRELSLLSSRNATGRNFSSVIAQIESGEIDLSKWITHRCDAKAFPSVVDDWLKPESELLKGVISFA